MNFRKYYYYAGSILKLLTGVREWNLILRIFLDLPVPEKKVISLRSTGLRFQVRGKMDIWSIKETFIDRFYEKYGVPVQDDWVIVDIGAGIGEYTLFAAAGHSGNTVHAYEPFPESFSLLKANLELNRVKGVQIFSEAVAGQSGTAELDLAGGEPLKFSTEAHHALPDALHVTAMTLSQVLDRVGKRCNVLKLDCEGAEYTILFNTPDVVLATLDHIVLEYHDRVTAYSHRDLVEFLSAKGFSVETVPNVVHSELGYLHAFRSPAGKP